MIRVDTDVRFIPMEISTLENLVKTGNTEKEHFIGLISVSNYHRNINLLSYSTMLGIGGVAYQMVKVSTRKLMVLNK